MSPHHETYEAAPLPSAHMPPFVRDVMTTQLVTVGPTTTVKELAHVLLDHDIRGVPVLDIGDVLVGVVSEADVICRECPSARRHTLGGLIDRALGHDHGWHDKAVGVTAEEIMTKDVISCTPNEPLTVAARRMLSKDVRMLPVLDDDRLVGVISRHDLLRLFDRPDSEVRARIAALLVGHVWAPKGHHITPVVADGIVHLSGTVRYPSDIDAIVSVIAHVPGVIEVRHHLTAQLPEPRLSEL